jgi:AraC family transcriptional regulator
MKQFPHEPFCARLVNHRQLSGVRLLEVLYPPTLRQPRHTHNLASFSYVLSGNYAETLASSRTHFRRPATVVLHPPAESHAVEFESGVRILSVEFDFEKLARLREHTGALDGAASCRSEKIHWLGKMIYREFRQSDSFSALALEGLILEFLAEASRRAVGNGERKFPSWLKKSKEFLHENFTDSLTLEELAVRADVHPAHFSRVFREKFGCSVGEYVRRLRVEFASRQLLSTDIPLAEIAAAAGFSDQSHFNRTFKSIFGVTPAEYRKTPRRS